MKNFDLNTEANLDQYSEPISSSEFKTSSSKLFSLLTFLLLLIGYSFKSQAQYVSHFGANTTSWKTLNVGGFTLENGTLDSLAFFGEILFGGENYHVFQVFSLEAGFYPNNWFVSGTSFFTGGDFLWMRESEDHSKLYLDYGSAEAPYGSEQVVSNMNLEWGNEFNSFEVVSIMDDMFGRKIVTLESGGVTNRLIEGVGATFFTGPDGQMQNLICQTKDGQSTFEFEDELLGVYCAGIPLSINSLEARNLGIKAYPNPALNQLTIEVENFKPTPFRITDSRGQFISSGILSSGAAQVDISNLVSGLYLLQLTETLQTVRFVKIK